MEHVNKEPVLCYVDKPWAYFTTRALERQEGDDWDDVPYEHNAEPPYEYRGMPREEPWEIVKVAWDGPYDTPADLYGLNSPWSVDAINEGCIAWLIPQSWNDNPGAKPIPAGTTLREFVRMMEEAGGTVYLQKEKTDGTSSQP